MKAHSLFIYGVGFLIPLYIGLIMTHLPSGSIVHKGALNKPTLYLQPFNSIGTDAGCWIQQADKNQEPLLYVYFQDNQAIDVTINGKSMTLPQRNLADNHHRVIYQKENFNYLLNGVEKLLIMVIVLNRILDSSISLR